MILLSRNVTFLEERRGEGSDAVISRICGASAAKRRGPPAQAPLRGALQRGVPRENRAASRSTHQPRRAASPRRDPREQ